MGWTSLTNGLRYGQTPDSFLRAEVEFERNGASTKILKSAFVGTTWYAAARCIRPATDKSPASDLVVALVILTSRRGGEFAYKDMDESCGPCDDACPAGILAMLSPADQVGGYAADWRARCAARRVASAEQAGKARKLKPGMVLRFPAPVRFTGGQEYSELRVTSLPYKTRGVILERLDGGGLYRVPARLLATAEVVTP